MGGGGGGCQQRLEAFDPEPVLCGAAGLGGGGGGGEGASSSLASTPAPSAPPSPAPARRGPCWRQSALCWTPTPPQPAAWPCYSTSQGCGPTLTWRRWWRTWWSASSTRWRCGCWGHWGGMPAWPTSPAACSTPSCGGGSSRVESSRVESFHQRKPSTPCHGGARSLAPLLSPREERGKRRYPSPHAPLD